PVRILLALALGLVLGIVCAAWAPAWVDRTISVAEPVGGMWLNALRMTIVPLVVALLITGIAASAEAARASRLATRALIVFVVLLWVSSIAAALLMPLFLDLFPLPAASAAELRSALSTSTAVGPVPGFGDFIRSIVPTNVVAAASESAILPLIVFVTLFAFALVRLPIKQRKTLIDFFQAIADTMLIMVNWVLWIAPIGVFALAYVVGARAGGAAFGALLHYVLILSAIGIVIWLAAWPLAFFGARISPVRFTRAVAAS